ncbi:methyl-accepting chemotaxis protein [Paenibacillus turicensis]|uniref:Methyl-accepting chemotaxis protein n=1 Tax=Paenibacillus turicensis TaxID=160487 RepID=A0ABS4FU32_9BACL|nr:methyl-accepting chemotaxis protein [Paenibacillus turicensis]MBP1906080.1 methyl-accepting chemotaxis protein [Paenibacillus turicensis]
MEIKNLNIKNLFIGKIASKIMWGSILTIFMTAICFSGLLYYTYTTLSEKLSSELTTRLSVNMQSLNDKMEVMGVKILNIQSADSQTYKQTRALFDQFKKEYEVKNVFILTNEGGKERFLVYSDTPDDFNKEYELTAEMKEAITSNKTILSDIYSDDDGYYQSIFVPMKNQQGQVAGIVGIDLDAGVIPNTLKSVTFYSIIVIISVIIVGLIMAFLQGRLISRPIKDLMKVTQAFAEGDLTQEIHVKGSDEVSKLSQAFQVMSTNMKQLIGHISKSSNEVAGTSEQLLQVVEESSASAEQVAVSMNSMAEGINEVVQSIGASSISVLEIEKQLSGVGVEVNDMQIIAKQVSHKASEGQNIVEQTLEQINKVEQVMQSSEGIAAELQQRSVEIGEVISIITGIAEQTNLLALNASIEAARVGEQGKGFAVVAGEVRKLAEQSASAAASITGLVAGTQQNSLSVIESINEGSRAIEEGQKLMSITYDNFQDIFRGIEQFTSQTEQLLHSLVVVEGSYQSISTSVQQISGVTQEQAAASEEVAASAEQQSAAMEQISVSIGQLSSLAQELQKAVNLFKI